MNIVNETLVISEDTINATKAARQLRKQQDYLRCCYDLLDALPVKHYARQMYYTYIIVDDDPFATPADLRIARSLRQRALKWAAKQLLAQDELVPSRNIEWQILSCLMPCRTAYANVILRAIRDNCIKNLKTLPRDNKPLPLP